MYGGVGCEEAGREAEILKCSSLIVQGSLLCHRCDQGSIQDIGIKQGSGCSSKIGGLFVTCAQMSHNITHHFVQLFNAIIFCVENRGVRVKQVKAQVRWCE